VFAGQNCAFLNGGRITGNVTMGGGKFVQNGSSVGGNLTVDGGGTFTLAPAATVGGNLTIQNIPPGSASNSVCGTTVYGNIPARAAHAGEAYVAVTSFDMGF
jgi:hypothetical protein